MVVTGSAAGLHTELITWSLIQVSKSWFAMYIFMFVVFLWLVINFFCSFHGPPPTRIWLNFSRQLAKSNSLRSFSMGLVQKGVVWSSLLKFKKPKLLSVCMLMTFCFFYSNICP